jgi:hypothetical protein
VEIIISLFQKDEEENMPKDILSHGNIWTGCTIKLAAGFCSRFVVSRRDVA